MKFFFAQKKDDNMASYRYRVKAPSDYLEANGWTKAGRWWEADIVIMGKHWHPAKDHAQMKECRRRGQVIAFDVCDWHMDGSLGTHYKRMISLASGVIVPSDPWASAGLQKAVHVAGDAYQWDEKPPVCRAQSPMRVLWYGHISNYPLLEKVGAPKDCVLEIVTSPGPHQFKTYSKEVLAEAFEWCDLVIIPADSPLKSPNRMFEAIRQGRFVVASDLPQHRPAGTYCGDINEGIEWYRSNLQEAFLRLQDAQTAVKSIYSPEVIGGQWKLALESIYQKAKSKRAA